MLFGGGSHVGKGVDLRCDRDQDRQERQTAVAVEKKGPGSGSGSAFATGGTMAKVEMECRD